MKRSEVLLGVIIISIGTVFLLNNIGVVDIQFWKMWPLAVILLGLAFQLGYFVNRKDAGLLVPGGMFLTFGILFLITSTFGWHLMARLWPVFPLGVAIGLFQLYLFGGRETEVLIPVAILGGFSLIALSLTLARAVIGYTMPLALILFGLYIIFNSKR